MRIALPPSLAGIVQLTVACVLPATALTLVGAPGTTTVLGTTWFDGLDSGLSPLPLVACTVNVYCVPLFRPVTITDVALAPETVAVLLPTVDVAV